MSREVTAAEAAALLREADNILILTHCRPDGDTLGSAGALCCGLRELGKTAFVLPNLEVTPRYADLVTDCYPAGDFSPQYIVTVDISDYVRLTENEAEYTDRFDLVIDHHLANEMKTSARLVRPQAGACAEVIFDVLEALEAPFTKEIARRLYTGLSTDTGCFKFSNTTPHTLRVAARCLEAGVDGGEINRRLFEVKSLPRFRMERIIFDTMEFHRDGTVALALLRRADIDREGADMDDLDSIASLPRTIEGVQVGITLTENRNGTTKVSMRTTKEVDAAQICAQLGGGGHMRAAGASLSCGLEEARRLILEATNAVCDGTLA